MTSPTNATNSTVAARNARFHQMHASGTFIIPNPYDIGSARLLEGMGFTALATTSAGFAGTLGRLDMAITRDELVPHVAALAAAVEVPLNVDAERCFSETPEGIAETIAMLADAGAAGISIEDWDQQRNHIDPFDAAVARVKAAATAARAAGVVLTARAENHLHGVTDLDDTLNRLRAYLDAGADVIYAPGLTTPDQIAQVVALGAPVNVLLMPSTPTVPQLTDLGVRRISTGGALAAFAQGAMVAAAQQLLDGGMYTPGNVRPPKPLVDQAFRPR
jgi:2-methylisocitrate lyase-like PEP mutase family enzyme